MNCTSESLYQEQNEALATQSVMDEDDFSSSCTGATSSISSSEVATSDDTQEINEIDDFPETSLSSTRFGQMMRQQSRRRRECSCCLDYVSGKCEGIETVAKKVDWPKIYNFNPNIMKLGENDQLMSW